MSVSLKVHPKFIYKQIDVIDESLHHFCTFSVFAVKQSECRWCFTSAVALISPIWCLYSLCSNLRNIPQFNCPRYYWPLTSKQLRSNKNQDDIARPPRSPTRSVCLLGKRCKKRRNRKQKHRCQLGINVRLW